MAAGGSADTGGWNESTAVTMTSGRRPECFCTTLRTTAAMLRSTRAREASLGAQTPGRGTRWVDDETYSKEKNEMETWTALMSPV